MKVTNTLSKKPIWFPFNFYEILIWKNKFLKEKQKILDLSNSRRTFRKNSKIHMVINFIVFIQIIFPHYKII